MIRNLFHPPKHDRWDDYFEPGEVLIWQGAPEPGPRSYLLPTFMSVFGIPFFLGGLAFAGTGLGFLISMDNLADFGLGLFLTAFSVPFLGVGAGLTIGTWVYAFIDHKHVRYALSSKSAYLAKSFFKHTLETYTIGADDAITLDQGRYDNVKFKTIHERDSDGDKTTRSIGFDGITNGREVYALIRQIQRDAQ